MMLISIVGKSDYALLGEDTHSCCKVLLSVVPPPSCVYYAAIRLSKYPLPSEFSPRNDAEETSPWTLPRLTNC
jgi:hypothetical protein